MLNCKALTCREGMGVPVAGLDQREGGAGAGVSTRARLACPCCTLRYSCGRGDRAGAWREAAGGLQVERKLQVGCLRVSQVGGSTVVHTSLLGKVKGGQRGDKEMLRRAHSARTQPSWKKAFSWHKWQHPEYQQGCAHHSVCGLAVISWPCLVHDRPYADLMACTCSLWRAGHVSCPAGLGFRPTSMHTHREGGKAGFDQLWLASDRVSMG